MISFEILLHRHEIAGTGIGRIKLQRFLERTDSRRWHFGRLARHQSRLSERRPQHRIVAIAFDRLPIGFGREFELFGLVIGETQLLPCTGIERIFLRRRLERINRRRSIISLCNRFSRLVLRQASIGYRRCDQHHRRQEQQQPFA